MAAFLLACSGVRLKGNGLWRLGSLWLHLCHRWLPQKALCTALESRPARPTPRRGRETDADNADYAVEEAARCENKDAEILRLTDLV